MSDLITNDCIHCGGTGTYELQEDEAGAGNVINCRYCGCSSCGAVLDLEVDSECESCKEQNDFNKHIQGMMDDENETDDLPF